MSVFSEILPPTQPLQAILAGGYKGVVLSGGPASVYEDGAPLPPKALFESGIPVLGICYGMQAMGYLLGGHVVPAERREYGKAEIELQRSGRRARGQRSRHGLDEPRRHGAPPAQGLHRARSDHKLPGRGDGGRGPPALRRSVPPGGRPHTAGTEDPGQLPLRVRRGPDVVDAGLHRHHGGRHPRRGERTACALRPLRRRGLGGGCRARPPRHRRPAHLRVRGQRAPAQG